MNAKEKEILKFLDRFGSEGARGIDLNNAVRGLSSVNTGIVLQSMIEKKWLTREFHQRGRIYTILPDGKKALEAANA